jgi:group I intron endonuclease
MMQSGVYEIRNSANGKRYIGSSTNLLDRLYSHRYMLNNSVHPNRHLQSAWNKYGAEYFSFMPLLYCDPENTLFYEQRCLDNFRPEYNNNPQAASSAGVKRTDEEIRKMSERSKSQMTDEMRSRISLSLTGKVQSEVSKQKKSQALKGRNHSEEHNHKVSASLMGHSFTDEVRQKMSEAQKRRFADTPVTSTERRRRSEAAKRQWAMRRGEL